MGCGTLKPLVLHSTVADKNLTEKSALSHGNRRGTTDKREIFCVVSVADSRASGCPMVKKAFGGPWSKAMDANM